MKNKLKALLILSAIIIANNLFAQLSIDETHIDCSCYGDSTGSIDITVSGGTTPYTYKWKTTDGVGLVEEDEDQSELTSGTYTCVVTDDDSNTDSIKITIDQPGKIEISLIRMDSSSCNQADGQLLITSNDQAVQPIDFKWSNGVEHNDVDDYKDSLIDIASGSYFITITDDNGCTADNIFSVLDQISPMAIMDSVVDPLCYGSNDGKAYASVTGGESPYTWEWEYSDSDSASAIDLAAGGVYVTVTDKNGCRSSAYGTLHEPEPLNTIGTTTDERCYGYCDGSIDAVAVGGTTPYKYAWSDDASIHTEDRSSLCPGDYTYTVTDAHGCDIVNTVMINGNLELSVTEKAKKDATCGNCNGEIEIEINGGAPSYSIEWTGGNATCGYPDGGNNLKETGLGEGTHHIKITDGYGCKDSIDIAIDNLAGPRIDSLTLTHNLCYGDADGKIIAHVSGGTAPLTYTWSPSGKGTITNDSIYENLPEGDNYSINVIDDNGCADMKINITITASDHLSSAIISFTDVYCYGYEDGTATIAGYGGTQPYAYSWNDPLAQTTDQSDSLAAGTYTGYITDANGCQTSSNVTIGEPDSLIIETDSIKNASNGVCNGLIDISVIGGTATYTYQWNTGTETEDLTDLCSGFYKLTVTDAKDCEALGSYTIIPEYEYMTFVDTIHTTTNACVFNTSIPVDSSKIYEFQEINSDSILVGWAFWQEGNSIFLKIGMRYNTGISLVYLDVVCDDSRAIKVYRFYGTYDSSTASMQTLDKNTTIEIYPNPAKDFVNIKVNNDELSNLSIYDISGKLIQTKSFNKTIQIETEFLNKGVYIFKIKTNKDIITKKIVIK